MLPKAAHRGGNGFKDEFNANKVQPVRAPLATLFDVEHLLAWGVANGAPMHLVRWWSSSCDTDWGESLLHGSAPV